MRGRDAILQARDVQQTCLEIDLVPPERNELAGAQAVTVV